MNEKLYLAIDVGTTKVCSLLARVSPGAELEVIGTGVTPSLGMKKGLVVDLEEMQQAIRASVEMASQSLEQELPKACVGVTGMHISSVHTSSVLKNGRGENGTSISLKEVAMVVKQSHPKVQPEQELLHVIPQSFRVDNLQGIRNPVGLSGHRLTVESHAIIGEAASLDNVVRALEGTGLTVGSMVLEPLASAEAVLTGDEKEAGVVLVDIGGGTTDIALFSEGAMCYAAVVPVAGFQFTNDLVVAYSLPYDVAEQAKLQGGHALPEQVEIDEWVEVPAYGEETPHHIRRRDLCHTLNDRAVELLRLVLLKVREAGLAKIPPAGVVFTGGATNLPGWEELARQIIPGPIRTAAPRDLLGLSVDLQNPTYSTSVGILLWGIRHPVEQEAYGSRNANRPFKKGRRWLRWLAKFIGPQDLKLRRV